MFRTPLLLITMLILVFQSTSLPYYTRSFVRTPTSSVEQYVIMPDKSDPFRIPMSHVHHYSDFEIPNQQVFYYQPNTPNNEYSLNEFKGNSQWLSDMMNFQQTSGYKNINTKMENEEAMNTFPENEAMQMQQPEMMKRFVVETESKEFQPENILNEKSDEIHNEDKSMMNLIQNKERNTQEISEFNMNSPSKNEEPSVIVNTSEDYIELIDDSNLVNISPLMKEQIIQESQAQDNLMRNAEIMNADQDQVPKNQQEKENNSELVENILLDTLTKPSQESLALKSETEGRELKMVMLEIIEESKMEPEIRIEMVEESDNLSAVNVTPEILKEENEITMDSNNLSTSSVSSLELQNNLKENPEEVSTSVVNEVEVENSNFSSEVSTTEFSSLKILESSSSSATESSLAATESSSQSTTESSSLRILESSSSSATESSSSSITESSSQSLTESSSSLATESSSLRTLESSSLSTTEPSSSSPAEFSFPSITESSPTTLESSSLSTLELSSAISESVRNQPIPKTESPKSLPEISESLSSETTMINLSSSEESLVESSTMSEILNRNLESFQIIVNDVTNNNEMSSNGTILIESRNSDVTTDEKAAEEISEDISLQNEELSQNISENTARDEMQETGVVVEKDNDSSFQNNNQEEVSTISTMTINQEQENELKTITSVAPLEIDINLESDKASSEEESTTTENTNIRQGRVNDNNSPTLFLHNNRFYVISGIPEFYANFNAYESPRTPIFSLQELQPIKPIEDNMPPQQNVKVQRIAPFRILVEESKDNIQNTDNERPRRPSIDKLDSQASDGIENEQSAKTNTGKKEIERKQQQPAAEGMREKPDDSSIAIASPDAIAISGRNGVASSKPIGTALTGERGISVASPHATAIGGFNFDDDRKQLKNRRMKRTRLL